jgi:hypothetical protein
MQKDELYIRHLQVLQDIRDKCEGTLNLPQICVVGDQSSGKSSALACITGIIFPVKSGICTKAPIVVECRRDQTLGQLVFEIQDQASPEKYRSVDLRALATEIENIQNKLLDCNGKSGSTPERQKTSQKEIRVKVRGPDQIDLVVVDLPGIINAGDGKEDTQSCPVLLLLNAGQVAESNERVGQDQKAALTARTSTASPFSCCQGCLVCRKKDVHRHGAEDLP